jgi:CheY-like chemotaxis protein
MAEAPLIFLVDDDRDFLDMETAILGSAGYRVSCFADPRVAFEAIRSAEPAARPSLVVSDLMMRNLDSGFTLAGALKGDPGLAAIPVIIVSAVSSQKGFDFRPRSKADLDAMKADAFFDKPVAPQALLGKVKELIR